MKYFRPKFRSEGKTSRRRRRRLVLCAALFLLVLTAQPAFAQKLGEYDRERGRQMLKTLKDDIKKNYYDPTFRGIDIEARFREADEAIKQAQSNGQIFGIIAQVLVGFNDSHLYFIPPQRPARTDYGWQMQMIGERCYVSAVKPGSDAETKGLREGDIVRAVDGMVPTREDLWKIEYLLYALRPQAGMRVVVERAGSPPRQLDVMAKVTELKRLTDLTDGNEIMKLIVEQQKASRLYRHRYIDIKDELFVWKMPQFDLPKAKVDDMADKFRKSKGVILDLRGNGGGAEETLLRLIGNFVERDVAVGELKTRKGAKPMTAKTVGDKAYKGKLVVLVDSDSGSSSEVFARVMQLEKRAHVLGDRTSGAVMRAMHHSHQVGMDIVAFYGVSVTDADLLMTDGKSLEHVGVTPDEVLLPTPADMAAKRDPVLARAAELLGVKITPEQAGQMFPIEWQ
ncbi:MAG TPA: S41 family peptidase [Pyrinomonadaceae bacterium]|nr:S41 family peptidase [Pyrinomonadaceae bacterium]